MGNCCSSFPEEQLPRPPPGRRGYPVGNTHNVYHTNPVLELLEEEYQIKRNFEVETKSRSRGKRYDRDKDIGPRRKNEWESRSKSRSGTRQRATRSGKRSRAVRPKNSRRRPKANRRRQEDFSEDEDEEDDSDSDDSEFETSDDDDEFDSDSDSDSDSEIYHRKMSKSVRNRRQEQPRNTRSGEKGKAINKDEADDYDEFLEGDEDGDDEEDYKNRNKQKRKRKKIKSKPIIDEAPKNRAKSKVKQKSKAKKVREGDRIALLENEEDENNVDNDDAEDEDEQEEINKYPQSKDYEAGGKGKQPETSNPYLWTNSSQIFDKNKSSIYQRARAKGSDRESIRQLEIQRHRKRRERETSLKPFKKYISESHGDDDWTDTDASSTTPSKRSGSTSSRLSSLFGPRNRSLIPEPTSHLMSPISPLTRPSVSSKSGETTFGASVIKASPLQEIVSADSLPANPEPKDSIITPPPAVHQRPASPLTKAAEPCPEGMKKVIFMSRGKRSSIKLIPSDEKHKATDDVEIILTK
ncbi:uncharacterized protein EAE97_003469 [Botrytis byssoidea]|uniref:Uncharacterized protein n=1 Tax=Botrytis byssoidea TaxID=139641 RepID=A0A9P5IQD6_9HELO|nr:uncharacterized protein EAE97_003469 [Botrytis byssoidea]KAF7948058.1 hypothetical protein EAE97_003469 [Botrytis byssoidea]